MKASVSLQDQKLRLLETLIKINDRKVIEKLYKLLVSENANNKTETVITDEMLLVLEEEWEEYRKNPRSAKTYNEVRSSAVNKLKAARKKNK